MPTREEDRRGIWSDGTMTGKRFAERIDVAYGTVKRWLREGMPCERHGNRLHIDLEIASEWVRAQHGDSIAVNRLAVVYFVRRDSDRAIKIGWASDLVRRLHELRRNEGCVCQIVACFEGAKPDELALHGRFADELIADEWFRPSDRLLGFIGSIGRTVAA